jgi:hypothetical protein
LGLMVTCTLSHMEEDQYGGLFQQSTQFPNSQKCKYFGIPLQLFFAIITL